MDDSWSDKERELVASYLEQGFVQFEFLGLSDCRLCGKVNGSAEATDGVYLWPEGLAHYVRDHSVKLPDEVLAHVRRRYDEAESLDVKCDGSAWPSNGVRLWPEGFADHVLEHPDGLSAEFLAEVRLHAEEMTLYVDRDWWPKVTSA